MTTHRSATVVAVIAGLVLLLVLVLVMAGRPGPQVATSPSPSPTATESPTPTATASPAATAAASPTPTAAPSSPRTAEEAARQLAAAIEASDYDRLRALIVPDGWVAGFEASEGLSAKTPDETIAWLREHAPQGQIRADVDESPLLTPPECCYPRGDFYIRSGWTDFETTGEQNVHLMLEEVGGVWYWSGALFRAPD